MIETDCTQPISMSFVRPELNTQSSKESQHLLISLSTTDNCSGRPCAQRQSWWLAPGSAQMARRHSDLVSTCSEGLLCGHGRGHRDGHAPEPPLHPVFISLNEAAFCCHYCCFLTPSHSVWTAPKTAKRQRHELKWINHHRAPEMSL